MPNKHEPHRQYEDTFKHAAIEFLESTGNDVDAAAAELGIPSADLRLWQKKEAANRSNLKSPSVMARLKAENEALRNEVVHLQVQWDILKTTLGVLSTTICTRETV